MDEMTILMRTLVVGLAKCDKKITEPGIELLEQLTSRAFSKVRKCRVPKVRFYGTTYIPPSPTGRERRGW